MPAQVLSRIFSLALGLGARTLFSIPDRTLRLIFGDPPAPAKGLAADAWAVGQVVGVLDRGPKQKRDPGPEARNIEQIRLETELLSLAVAAPRPRGLEIRELDLDPAGQGGALPARLYRPLRAASSGPLLVFFHGGGWAVGSIASHDRACALLACSSGVNVLSVEYRLTPEHPFPAAPDDALRAWRAVVADPERFGTEPGRIAVGGDSAGGNLAAVLCQDLHREGLDQPALQLLIYPVTELGSKRQSMRDFATGYYLTSERMGQYSKAYTPRERYGDVRASPLKAQDLSGLAPAWVLNCLADPLRDEGEQYARRLAEAGVEVRSDRLPLVHAWFNMTRSRSARSAHSLLANGLADYMYGHGPVTLLAGD
jgi:acetyl esterase